MGCFLNKNKRPDGVWSLHTLYLENDKERSWFDSNSNSGHYRIFLRFFCLYLL